MQENTCRVLFQSGDFTYELIHDWVKWPSDMENAAVCGIVGTKEGTVLAATRSKKYPICELDQQGNLIRSFGEDLGFARTHGISLEEDGTIWCCDDQSSVIYHLTREGKVLRQLGEKGVFSDSGYDPTVRWPHDLYTNVRAAEPFNRPTKLMQSPWGDYYCTDGYGNTAIHRFDKDLNLIRTWGGPGNTPGKFRLPHNLAFDCKGRIWICDRENFRVQIFDREGEYLTELDRLGYPSEVCSYKEYIYLCEGDGQVSIYNMEFERIAVIGYPGCFARIHSIGMDRNGNIYLGRIEGGDSLFMLKNVNHI